MLDRAAGDCDLAGSILAPRAVDEDISGRWRMRAHVAFDITTGDVYITHISGARDDSSTLVVTDVAGSDI